jgi:SHS2 domain-containing protein
MRPPRPRIEEIEHTADWAIRVHAPDLPGLFTGAATGMFRLLADLSAVAPQRQIEIELAAVDVETLLVDWLNELLYRAELEGVVFVEFGVEELIAGDGARLRARAAGGRAPQLHAAIKAATFGGLCIVPEDGGVRAEIVFDV